MLNLASYIMKGQTQALIATLVLSLLTVFLSPLGLLLGSTIGLVALQVNVQSAFKLLIVAVVVTLAMGIFITGGYFTGFITVVEYLVPVFLAVVWLKNTQSLEQSLLLLLALTAIGIVGFHFIVGDTVIWWQELYKIKLLPMLQTANVDFAKLELGSVFNQITMIIGFVMVNLWFSIVLLARYWQGSLYYPGQFKTDFLNFKLPVKFAYLTILIVFIGIFFGDSLLLKELSVLAMAGFLFQGVAIIHTWVNNKKASKMWLVGMYILLFIFPQTLFILASIALADSWLNLRQRWLA